jgi:hypothetical protein
MKYFQTGGLEGVAQFPGHNVHQISLPSILSMGHVKDIVYQTKVWDIANLKPRTTDAIATTDEGTVQGTWQEILYRLDVLCATNGAHIVLYYMGQ